MGRLALRVLAFSAERIRMICLALALLVAAKIAGGLILKQVLPEEPEKGAIAEPQRR